MSERSYLRIKQMLANQVPSRLLTQGFKSSDMELLETMVVPEQYGMEFDESLINVASQMRQLNSVKDYLNQPRTSNEGANRSITIDV
jgi:hypothetical protein